MDDPGNIRSLSREKGKTSEEPAFSLNLHAALAKWASSGWGATEAHQGPENTTVQLSLRGLCPFVSQTPYVSRVHWCLMVGRSENVLLEVQPKHCEAEAEMKANKNRADRERRTRLGVMKLFVSQAPRQDQPSYPPLCTAFPLILHIIPQASVTIAPGISIGWAWLTGAEQKGLQRAIIRHGATHWRLAACFRSLNSSFPTLGWLTCLTGWLYQILDFFKLNKVEKDIFIEITKKKMLMEYFSQLLQDLKCFELRTVMYQLKYKWDL